jgi:hypothetical protein
MLCDYGCGQEAKYQFKNGKWCCEQHRTKCPKIRESVKGKNNPFYNKKHTIKTKEKKSKRMKELRKDPTSKYNSTSYRNKQKLTIKDCVEKYSFFSKIEEMRYNPNKPKEKEIQVHCKNHNCKNSKEKDGWFTPTYIQLYERIRALEKPYGMIENNFYCSQKCKKECPLYDLRNDPYEVKDEPELPYTANELQILNQFVMDRDNEICYYCGEHATIVHHLRPKKLEPFFALDPDYAISVCIKCHYKYGHPTGSEHSTGNLAKIVCSVESQKFLNQKLEK